MGRGRQAGGQNDSSYPPPSAPRYLLDARPVSNTPAQVEKSQTEYDTGRVEHDGLQEETAKSLDVADLLAEVPIRPVKSDTQVIELGPIRIPK